MWLSLEKARKLFKGAVIGEGAVIGKGRKGVLKSLTINGMNNWGVTGYICDDGLIISIGCMNNYAGLLIEETRKEILKKYTQDHLYFNVLDLIEKWHEQNK